MDAELVGHDHERSALRVACRGQGNRLVGQLPDHPPTGDTGPVEVVDHRRSVQLISAGESVNRRAFLVEADQCIDVGRRQSSLDRV